MERKRIKKLEDLLRLYMQSAIRHINCGNGEELCSLCKEAAKLGIEY